MKSQCTAVLLALAWFSCQVASAQLVDLTPYQVTDALDISALVLPADVQPTVFSLAWQNGMVWPNEYTVICASEDLTNWYQPFETPATPSALVYLASTNAQLFFRLKNQIGQ